MRQIKLSWMGLFVALFTTAGIFAGCQKDAVSPDVTSNAKPVANTANCTGYLIELDRDVASMPGKTIFTWTITNPNPGNGSKNTIQDLSHWSFVPGLCLEQNWQAIEAAAYRYGTTGEFTGVPFTGYAVDDLRPDPSLKNAGCFSEDVFKFDIGTSGKTPTQYRIILDGVWGTADLNVWFKSGTNTGCCSATYAGKGIGCPETDEDCSFSQGYWFANNKMHPDGVHPWPTDVNIGGKVYTNAEGIAIWNASNKGGITDSKKAFTQLAAIKLSGVDISAEGLNGAVSTIENWLGSIDKLNGNPDSRFLPNQTVAEITLYGNARAAAGVISEWIRSNHCD